MENGGKIEDSGPSDMACSPGYDNKADRQVTTQTVRVQQTKYQRANMDTFDMFDLRLE